MFGPSGMEDDEEADSFFPKGKHNETGRLDRRRDNK
jgi:hypothetical protein